MPVISTRLLCGAGKYCGVTDASPLRRIHAKGGGRIRRDDNDDDDEEDEDEGHR